MLANNTPFAFAPLPLWCNYFSPVAAFSMQINAAACDAPLPEEQKNRMAESQSAFSLGYSFIFMCVLLLHFKLLSIIIFSPTLCAFYCCNYRPTTLVAANV